MISINQFTKKINDELNTLFIANNGRTNYVFRIVSETARYKNPTRAANSVTRYIHGVLSQINSTVGDTATKTKYGVVNARLVILIPIIRDEKGDELSPQLVAQVRALLDKWSDVNQVFAMNDESGISYVVSNEGFSFSSGERQMNSVFGETFSLTAYIDFNMVQEGLNSRSITFTLDGEEIPLQDWVTFRKTTMEGAQRTDGTGNLSVAKNVPQFSQLNLKFNMPAGTDNVSAMFFDYLDKGLNPERTLVKTRINADGTKTVLATYKVIVADVTETGADIKNVALSVTLAENYSSEG
nr:MAG TPA: hypothetical protein [Bacteriophage sp.]